MAWILLNTRRAELTRSINDLTREKLQLTRKMQELTAFTSAIADGNVTPDELSSMSSEFAIQGIDLNEAAFNYADEHSETMTNVYLDQYSGLTQDEYFANSSLMEKASLFWDAQTGDLDGNQIKTDLMEKYMKEYVNNYVEPQLKAYEDAYNEEKINLETQVQTMQAELQQLDEQVSNNIQQDVIKLA